MYTYHRVWKIKVDGSAALHLKFYPNSLLASNVDGVLREPGQWTVVLHAWVITPKFGSAVCTAARSSIATLFLHDEVRININAGNFY